MLPSTDLSTLTQQITVEFCSDQLMQAESLAEIESSLALLSQQESSVKIALDSHVAFPKLWMREIARLDLLRGNVGSLALSTRSICNDILAETSSTAGRISASVNRLDSEQARVNGTLKVVEQVAELKACVLGVTGSMGAPQDWETAASYHNRASQIPNAILTGAFAEETVPTAEVPDPPKVTLGRAAEALQSLFLREFEKAAIEGNGAKVTRFFKLFPLIGKPQVGLEVYGRYVCQGVASRARANLSSLSRSRPQKESLLYANALTMLFEHVAQIIENHGGLVERHYGPGRMVKVIERLQSEVDVQGGILIDTLTDERNIDRKLTDIRAYAFTFLLQSFLPPPPARVSTPRASSPAKKSTMTDDQTAKDEVTDLKEIDGLMSEMAIMLSRWSFYAHFIASKCTIGLASNGSSNAENMGQPLMIPPLLSNSGLVRKVADKLVGPFNAMTVFFFRRSVEKAFQLDEQPSNLTFDHKKPIPSHPPYITSAVDDVMYIVNQVVDRTLATSQVSVITNVIPTISRVLGSDFIGIVQRKMRDDCYPKGLVQGALPPENTTIAFLVLLNNLDVAVDYNLRIVESHVDTSSQVNKPNPNQSTPTAPLSSLFPLGHDALVVGDALKSLHSSFDAKAFELIGDGIYVVFKNIMKPRLRPLLADAFRQSDYQLTQEELQQGKAAAEPAARENSDYEGVVKEIFQRGWDILTKPIYRLLTDRNYAKVTALVVSYLAEILEKRIWSYYGRLDNVGAVRLERDVAGIANAVVRDGKYGLREAFARCTQICVVMNMEDDEWEESRNQLDSVAGVDVDWKLNLDERSRARAIVRNRG